MLSWPNFISQFFNGLALGALLSLISSGLTIIYGTLGVLNLAHGAMFMLGGYAGYVAYQQTGSFALAVLTGALFMAVLGLVLERVIIRHFYRRPHEDQILVTFGLGIVMVELVRLVFGSDTVSIPPPPWAMGVTSLGFLVYPTYRIVVLGIAAVALAALYVVLYRTRIGMVVRAGIEDSGMVDMLGINVFRVFMVVFGIGAMAGGLCRHRQRAGGGADPGFRRRHSGRNVRGGGDRRRRLVSRRGAGRPDRRGDPQPHLDDRSQLRAGHAVRGHDAGAGAAPARTFGSAGASVNRQPLWHRWWPEAAAAVGLLIAPYVLPPLGFPADTVNRIVVWGLFGLGFDLLFGYTGLLSFGQSAFFGTGGFVAAYLLTNNFLASVLLALVIGTLAAMLAGVLVGMIALRRTGIYFAMITVAIAEVFFFLENSPLSDFTGGENGIPGVPAPSFRFGPFHYPVMPGWSMYWFLAACFFVGLVVARRIVASPVGAILVAIRDNPQRVQALGHSVWAYKLTVFVIAAAYAGFAGGLLGVLQGYMPPDAFTFDTSGQLVIQTVIGGAGTLFGPLIGAAVWLYLRDFLQGPVGLGNAWRLGLGVIFVLLVCFLRHGILGGIRDLFARPQKPAPEESPQEPSMAPLASVGPAARRRVPDHGYAGPILETENLTRRYGGLLANRDITFSVNEGELRGVIGPNGAGKSTFFKMLTCEVPPTSGKIMFHGHDITGRGVAEVCQLGLTKSYQVNQLFGRLTVRQNITIAALAERRGIFRADLLRRLHRVPGLGLQVEQTLALVNLSARADTPVAALAYGEKRRLEIGLALASSPTLLLLDEPLAGMSPRERAETVQLLRNIRRGRTLVIVEHDMDAMFELAERITVLAEGTLLAEGTPAEIQRNRLVQEAYLGGVAAA